MTSNLKNNTKRTLFIWPLLLLSACVSDTTLNIEGTKHSLNDFSGQWLLINYWAEWCKPCIEEIPELNQLDQRKNLTVLAYNFDQLPPAELATAATNLNLKLQKVIDDPSMALGVKKPTVLPATYVIKPNGEQFGWLLGPQTSASISKALGISD